MLQKKYDALRERLAKVDIKIKKLKLKKESKEAEDFINAYIKKFVIPYEKIYFNIGKKYLDYYKMLKIKVPELKALNAAVRRLRLAWSLRPEHLKGKKNDRKKKIQAKAK